MTKQTKHSRALARAIAASLVSVVLASMPTDPAYAQNPCSIQMAHDNSAGAGAAGDATGAWKKILSWLGVQREDPPVGPGGIGGTGVQTARPGLGGTGVSGDGIGGTGIVGVITGFGSICVNGLEVEFDSGTPLSDNGNPAPLAQLAVGQIVAINAKSEGESIVARRIAVMHAAVGPIGAIDHDTGDFKVLGQTAHALRPADLSGLQVGNWVRVSGHRLALGEIAASRVEAIPAQQEAQLVGTVGAMDANSWTLEGTPVQPDKRWAHADVSPGTEVLVSGVWNGASLRATRVQPNPTRSNLGTVRQVVAEGYIHGIGLRDINLGHTTMVLDPHATLVGGTAAQLVVNQRVQVSGQVGLDQRITVDRIEFRGTGGRSGHGIDDRSGSRRGRDSGGSDDSGSSGKGGSGESGSSGSSGSGSGRSGGSGSSGGSGGSGGGGKR
jgi:hypothetical protein